MASSGQSHRTFAAAAAVVLTLAACGGATSSGLFDGPAAATGSPDASVTPNPDSAAPSSGGSPLDAAVHDASTSHEDASPPAPTDASPVVDSAPPPPPPDLGIPCGKRNCDPTVKVCCVTDDGQGNRTFACDTADNCSSNGNFPMPCAKAADCALAGSPAGTVCCVTEGTGSQVAQSVACVPAAQCVNPSTQSWMCDPSDPNACPAGDKCAPSQVTIPPYSICVKGP